MPQSPKPQKVWQPTPEQLIEQATLDPNEGNEVTSSDPSPSPQPADAQPAAAGHQHTRQLTQMAIDIGMSLEDIGQTAPDALQDIILQTMRRQREERPYQAQQQQQQQTPAPLPDIDLGLSPEEEADINPAILKAMKRAAGTVAAENQQLRAHLSHAAHTQQVQQITDRFDREFSKYPEFLGEGGFHEIVQGSPEMSRRAAVANEALADTSNLPLATKVKRAVERLFGAVKPTQAKQSEAEKKAQQWRESTLAQPTNRNGAKEDKGEKAAVRGVSKFLADRGYTSMDQELEGELPD